MSDRPDDTPVEYQDSTQGQDADQDGASERGSRPDGSAQAGSPQAPPRPPPSTGGPDAPPVVRSRRADPQPAATGEGPRRGEGNLVQLPEGAALGSDEPPSDEDRERLAKFAGAAHHEMHGEDQPRTRE
jgi:hypothetical protein